MTPSRFQGQEPPTSPGRRYLGAAIAGTLFPVAPAAGIARVRILVAGPAEVMGLLAVSVAIALTGRRRAPEPAAPAV